MSTLTLSLWTHALTAVAIVIAAAVITPMSVWLAAGGYTLAAMGFIWLAVRLYRSGY